MDFTSDERVRGIQPLVDALFRYVLPDEEPTFVGDEATLLDVAAAPVEVVLERCSTYYRTSVSVDDLRKPLWQLLPHLERRRTTAASG